MVTAAEPQDPPRDDQPFGRGTLPAQQRHPGLSLPPGESSVSHVVDGFLDRTSSKKPEKLWRHTLVLLLGTKVYFTLCLLRRDHRWPHAAPLYVHRASRFPSFAARVAVLTS